MRVVATGATGFIGKALCAELLQAGHTLQVLTRHPARARDTLPAGVQALAWDPAAAPSGGWVDAVQGADALVSLAGEPIAQRWTADAKRKIRESRVRANEALVQALRQAPGGRHPGVLVTASGVNYYGDRGEETLTEASPPGTDFLAAVCVAWEGAARSAEPLGVRVVPIRFGMVLEQGASALQPWTLVRRLLGGGKLAESALEPVLMQYRYFAGGPLGSGRQWWSWIHRDDVVGLIRFALERDDVTGPLNGVAPQALRMRDFGATIGRVLGRPSRLTTPAFALKLALGEIAGPLLLGSLKVHPQASLAAGYTFTYPDLESALRSMT